MAMRVETLRKNADITVPEVSVIGPDGEQLGVMSISEALRRAQRPGLDLVEIRPETHPPLCQIFVRGRVLPRPTIEFEIRDNQIKETTGGRPE